MLLLLLLVAGLSAGLAAAGGLCRRLFVPGRIGRRRLGGIGRVPVEPLSQFADFRKQAFDLRLQFRHPSFQPRAVGALQISRSFFHTVLYRHAENEGSGD